MEKGPLPLLVITVLAAIALAVPHVARSAQKHATLHRVPVQPGSSLEIDLETGGEVRIRGWAERAVQLEARLGGVDGERSRYELLASSGHGARLRSWQVGSQAFSVDHIFELRVPHSMSVVFRSNGGGLDIADVTGSFSGSTLGGDISLYRVTGDAHLTTNGGAVRLSDSNLTGQIVTHGGPISIARTKGSIRVSGPPNTPVGLPKANPTTAGAIIVNSPGGQIHVPVAPLGARLVTGGGDIIVDSARRFVDAQTGGGNITLRDIDGTVTARTGAGDITVSLAPGTQMKDRAVNVISGRGSVTLVLPPGIDTELSVETAYTQRRGEPVHIRSDFPVTMKESPSWEGEQGITPRKYVRARGVVGRGGSPIHVQTVDGDVEIIARGRPDTHGQ